MKKSKSIILRPIKGWWVVSYKNATLAHWSISGTRKSCIEEFLKGSVLSWDDADEFGWYAYKVNINFEHV